MRRHRIPGPLHGDRRGRGYGRKANHLTDQDRYERLGQRRDRLETPMIVLASLWLALPAFGPTGQPTPVQEAVSDMTRGLFRLEQVLHPVRAVHIASSSGELAMSLLLPALWIFSLARALRAARPVLGVRLVGVLGSINRGMRTTGRAMRRHGSATCWRSSGRWLRSPRPACRVSSIVRLGRTDDVDALRWT